MTDITCKTLQLKTLFGVCPNSIYQKNKHKSLPEFSYRYRQCAGYHMKKVIGQALRLVGNSALEN